MTESKMKMTVHLIDGTKLTMHGGATREELHTLYKCLGAEESRIKFPTAADTVQFLPASSVLRIEAKGDWSE